MKTWGVHGSVLTRTMKRTVFIGFGYIGIEPFKQLVNDQRFLEHPMTLETPGGDEWFRRNLKRLFQLRQ